MRRASLYAIGILALVMLVTTPAAAQETAEEPVNLSIKPVGTPDSYFTLTAEPGEVVDLEVELSNHGNNPILVQIYATDAYSLINGGFGVRLFDEPTSGATKWIDFPSEAFELDGQASTIRSIQLEIPADARAGEYLSALVIQNANPTGGTGEGVGFQQVNRQAIAVAVTLPGELVPGLTFGDVTHKFAGGNSVLLAEVKNTGNVHMQLEGQFSVTDSGGAEVMNQPVTMGTVYAGTSTLLEVPVGSALDPGDFQVSFELGNADLNISQQLQSALVTVPEAPAAPIPANAAPEPAADAGTAPVDAPAAAGAEPTPQSGIAAWMIVAGFAAALILGAGGAVLGVALMRRRDNPASPAPVAMKPSPSQEPSLPPVQPVAESVVTAPSAAGVPAAPVAADRPEPRTADPQLTAVPARMTARQPQPVGRQRTSSSIRGLLNATSGLRGETAAAGSSTTNRRA